jgi:hypothetical protein
MPCSAIRDTSRSPLVGHGCGKTSSPHRRYVARWPCGRRGFPNVAGDGRSYGGQAACSVGPKGRASPQRWGSHSNRVLSRQWPCLFALNDEVSGREKTR